MAGAADSDLRLGIDTDFLKQSVDRAQTVFDNFNRKSVRQMGRIADRGGAQNSVIGQMMYPSAQSRSPEAKMSKMKNQQRKQNRELQRMADQSMRELTKSATKAAKASPFAAWERDLKKFKREAASIDSKGASKSIFGGGGVFDKGGSGHGQGGSGRAGRAAGAMGRGAMGAGRMAGRGVKGVGKAGIKAGMFGGGAIMGFMMSAFREAVGNFEQQQRSRLDASSTLGRGAGRGGGSSMGYNSAEAASMRAQGGRSGIGAGAGHYSMQLARGIGQEGIGLGGGIMNRQNLRGSKGGKSMMKQMSVAFATAVETGLDRARIPEFLSGLNDLAEQQISITPGKDMYKSFTRELGMLAQGGLKGKYGKSALQQAHGAIQGASGVGQQHLMRYLGFGKGKGLTDVLLQQEKGAAGGNIGKVMKGLQKDYGAGKYGGLSASGLQAFKGMGMGSMSMGKKFGEVYLQGGGTSADKQKKVSDIMAKEQQKQADGKLKNMPRIQVEAYKNMASFGGTVKRMASRFDRMAKDGAKWYPMLKQIDAIQKKMVDHIRPIMSQFSKIIPSVGKAMSIIVGPMAKGITAIVGSLAKLVMGISAFGKGYARGGISGAFNALGTVYKNNSKKGPAGSNATYGLGAGGLRDKGFSNHDAKTLLSMSGGNLAKATNTLTNTWNQTPVSVQNQMRDKEAQRTPGKNFEIQAMLGRLMAVHITINNKNGSKVAVAKKTSAAKRNANRKTVTVKP